MLLLDPNNIAIRRTLRHRSHISRRVTRRFLFAYQMHSGESFAVCNKLQQSERKRNSWRVNRQQRNAICTDDARWFLDLGRSDFIICANSMVFTMLHKNQ